jgi:hypothetical protein
MVHPLLDAAERMLDDLAATVEDLSRKGRRVAFEQRDQNAKRA